MKYILPSALLLLFCLNGFAQDRSLLSEATELDKEFFDNLDTIKNKKGEVLKAVIVTTHKTPKPVTALRSGLKPMDVPQTIQVIGAEIIEQQQAIRLSEVLKNANGVYVGSARGGA